MRQPPPGPPLAMSRNGAIAEQTAKMREPSNSQWSTGISIRLIPDASCFASSSAASVLSSFGSYGFGPSGTPKR